MRIADAIRSDPEFIALRTLSAGVGVDPALVQGAGGNTSLKRDSVLWIKASGTWLMHAAERDIMVPVGLAPFHRTVAQVDVEPVFLLAAQEVELVDWNAEKYRQALSAEAGR